MPATTARTLRKIWICQPQSQFSAYPRVKTSREKTGTAQGKLEQPRAAAVLKN
jgi:hypothetical protein